MARRHLVQKALRTLAAVGETADHLPDNVSVLADDAARYSGTAILAYQGLRSTTFGGHHAVVALCAQFGGGFRPGEQCGDDATNVRTPPGHARPPRMTKRKEPCGTRRGYSKQLSSSCPP